ncbi:FAD-dependent monooxygenase [Brasilonema octagenarum UFV-E1]|uniref:FAD-dependent monooxygenase n=1 Tax=Brasilonema sennae CENA114 TaxID=415709 RepID=A0A856ML96_9CYAN|nr:NAD(P)/FAD-dependent oxidoreductase [Brasilonema sennae]QDL10331.1 FAD-dependent monooxygenase [Brasilonema sennae CENA114]QDL16679.1 FAD-dependent monooxygenase [Brasilonema octagenarum UFV-E1]
MIKRVVIVGAGPSGVLLAHYLLRRDEQYNVEIYERRSDPQTVPFSSARTFPLVLNQRGMTALSKVEGILAAIKAVSLESTGSLVHQKKGKTQFLPRKKPILILDRRRLVVTLLKMLTQQYSSDLRKAQQRSYRLKIHFDHQCKQVDFEAKTVTFENTAVNSIGEVTVGYDLLIGADGARSRVREQFLSTNQFELEKKYVPSAYKSIFLPAESAASLKAGYIHTWRSSDGIFATLVHDIDGLINGTVNFPRENNPIVNFSTKEQVWQFFREYLPEIAELLPESEVEAFLNRPISTILTIRCNRYHHGDSVLLIGDAAHATSPSLGQGCNASLEDVAFFDQLLDEYPNDIGEVLKQFTLRRKPDAHALVELSDYTFPLSSKLLFLELFIRLRTAQFMHQLFPRYFSPSLLQLLSETTIPYSEILNSHKGWISKVKQANEKFLERQRSPQHVRLN